MRKNFINKILMLFEVSHSFYFILQKDGIADGRKRRGYFFFKRTVHENAWDDDDIGVHSYFIVCMCVCVCVQVLFFVSITKIVCLQSTGPIQVYLQHFSVFRIFLSSFFVIFITLILTFVLSLSIILCVEIFMRVKMRVKYNSTTYNTIHNRIIDF